MVNFQIHISTFTGNEYFNLFLGMFQFIFTCNNWNYNINFPDLIDTYSVWSTAL